VFVRCLGLRMYRVFSISLLAILLASCGPPRPATAPKLDPQGSAQKALQQYDVNSDGLIADKELDKCPGLKAALKFIDANQDGKLSAEEITTRFKALADSKTAFYSANCQVNLDGRPLAGATVRLIPEEFMGAEIKPATGETDANGTCALAVEGTDIQGVNYGIYRIEVSKKDANGSETLPVKYNRETQLGDAVPGGSNPEGGILLNLTTR
jgi:hypothetical protein